jgi:hypothetical protein
MGCRQRAPYATNTAYAPNTSHAANTANTADRRYLDE